MPTKLILLLSVFFIGFIGFSRPVYSDLINPANLLRGKPAEMFRAGHKGDVETVARLLKEGMNVNTVDEYGYSLLIIAAKNGDKKLAELLLKNGADVNKYVAHFSATDETAVRLAAEKGDFEMVKLLVEAGAEINYKNSNPLIVACARGDKAMVIYLIEKGADVSIYSDKQTSPTNDDPMSAAYRNKHTEIVDLLKKYGAKSHYLVELPRKNETDEPDMAVIPAPQPEKTVKPKREVVKYSFPPEKAGTYIRMQPMEVK